MDSKKDVRLPIPMDVQKKSEGSMTAISCPACGAGAAFGQAGCAYCGSGLLREHKTDIGRFGIPNNATEWKVGEAISENEELNSILKRMEEQTPEGQYSYVVWKGYPAIVGGDIDAKKARVNFRELVKEVKRENLGSKWTSALDEFHHLQVDLSRLDDSARIGLGRKHWDMQNKEIRIDSERYDFFEKPTFKNIESFMSGLPLVGDDADQLRFGIKTVRNLMIEPST